MEKWDALGTTFSFQAAGQILLLSYYKPIVSKVEGGYQMNGHKLSIALRY